MKRPQRWQLEKQRTAKAIRSLPVCEQCGIKPGYGFAVNGRWLCVKCAAREQRAQRERT